MSCHTLRESCGGSRTCAAGSTICRCSTNWRPKRAAPTSVADADAELKSLREDIEAMEVRTLLSGEYDEREALITIRSGAGGVDAADWAEMLMRMYVRWAEKHKYPVEIFDTSYAEEAGIKSATFAVHAPFAYGTLSVEQGHAPAGANQPVRQPESAPDVVRGSRGAACGGDHRPHRHPRKRCAR